MCICKGVRRKSEDLQQLRDFLHSARMYGFMLSRLLTVTWPKAYFCSSVF